MSSVRDENPNRPRAKQPALQKSHNIQFWAPIDPEAGGTWWAVNEYGHTLILLNGAFTNHLPNTRSYRKSRGLIVKELAENADLITEWELLDLTDIEPFTLVIKQFDTLFECRWDGIMKFTKEINSKKEHIWSSATLYTQMVQQNRKQLFSDFLKSAPSETSEIIDFLNKYQEKDNGFIMRRFENLRSLSISTFHFHRSSVDIYYKDLISEETSNHTVQLRMP